MHTHLLLPHWPGCARVTGVEGINAVEPEPQICLAQAQRVWCRHSWSLGATPTCRSNCNMMHEPGCWAPPSSSEWRGNDGRYK